MRRKTKLKAPMPYFGGKARVGQLAWSLLGDCDNYVEPFCGSCAVLLARPTVPRIETVNDFDAYVVNCWRSLARDPAAVAEACNRPVSELDLHAEHRWLVGAVPRPAEVPADLADDPAAAAAYLRGWRDSYGAFDAAAFRRRMRQDIDYYDPLVAGRWLHGICCWIGGGWCRVPAGDDDEPGISRAGDAPAPPDGKAPRQVADVALIAPDRQKRSKVRIAGHNKGSRGKGVHAGGRQPHEWEQVPYMGDAVGMDANSVSHQERRPIIAAPHSEHGLGINAGGRPHLADAYDIGSGVHGNGAAGTCEQRRAWLMEWFGRLRDRLRNVRVCCGDWRRVVLSESVTTRLGLTGVFLDPPYSAEAGRARELYAVEDYSVAHDVRAWCLERGSDPRMRIVLAGYEGEGHEALEAAGWRVIHWKTGGGYGNRTAKGRKNAGRERLWASPHCLAGPERTLFD